MDAYNSSRTKMEGRDTLISRTHWPTSLAYLAKHKPLRSTVPIKRVIHPQDDIQVVLWPPWVHSYGVCSQAHSTHAEGRGQEWGENYKDALFTVQTMSLFIRMGFLRYISDPHTSLMTTVLKQKNAGHITSERSSRIHVSRTWALRIYYLIQQVLKSEFIPYLMCTL